MVDPRLAKVAEVLVHYSLALQPNQLLRLLAHEAAADLVRAVYREATRAGAHVLLRLVLDGLDEILLKEGSDEQLAFHSPLNLEEARQIDAALNIMAASNTKALSSIDPTRSALRQRAGGPQLALMMEREGAGTLRWCATLFPTNAYAQEAEMSLGDYEDFVYGACLLDEPDPVAAWRALSAQQQGLVERLNRTRELRILAPGTDLTLSVTGRAWVNSDGRKNLPDGEVFTGPVEDSAEGYISFPFPAVDVNAGRTAEGVRLGFEAGRVVEATANRGAEVLHALLETDAGARYLGEVAFGTNAGIQRVTGNPLFDEKMGGTFHLALGASYPETGGRNQSGLHWDIVCDLRQESVVFADGAPIYRNGQFLD